MLLAYRRKTGCKQYVFDNYPDLVKFFCKDCYKDEDIRITEYSDEGTLKRDFKTNTRDFVYGVGVQLDFLRDT